MPEPRQPSYMRTAHVEDSEDELVSPESVSGAELTTSLSSIGVVVFESSHGTNNAIDTTAVNTNNVQNNTSMKRTPLQRSLTPEDRVSRANSHENIPSARERLREQRCYE